MQYVPLAVESKAKVPWKRRGIALKTVDERYGRYSARVLAPEPRFGYAWEIGKKQSHVSSSV